MAEHEGGGMTAAQVAQFRTNKEHKFVEQLKEAGLTPDLMEKVIRASSGSPFLISVIATIRNGSV